MKIYCVMSIHKEEDHVVIAKSESEAIKTVVNYLNQFRTFHLLEPDDFCASVINVDEFSETTIIN